jgi:hypothetical protein
MVALEGELDHVEPATQLGHVGRALGRTGADAFHHKIRELLVTGKSLTCSGAM